MCISLSNVEKYYTNYLKVEKCDFEMVKNALENKKKPNNANKMLDKN